MLVWVAKISRITIDREVYQFEEVYSKPLQLNDLALRGNCYFSLYLLYLFQIHLCVCHCSSHNRFCSGQISICTLNQLETALTFLSYFLT